MNNESTIDAFLDGETIESSALDTALAEPTGRAYLIDALALRQLMVDSTKLDAMPVQRRSTLLSYASAAAIALALVGFGYAAGVRKATPETSSMPTNAVQHIVAPEPTRVIELRPGVNWHESKGGD